MKLFSLIAGVFAFRGEYICYILVTFSLRRLFYEKVEEDRIIC